MSIMSINALARACACVGLLATTAMPSFAASAETDAFLANVRLRAVFVAKASALAAERAGSDRIRRFAAAQGEQQVAVLDALEGTPGPAPHNAVADLGAPMTGRSVGKDATVDPSTFTAPAGLGALMPAATIGLDRLASSKGVDFDRLYAGLVRGVLGDEAAFLQAYGKTGDDEAIRAVAVRELPRVTADIADIAALD